jgi:uncharacterized iron-regulated protein
VIYLGETHDNARDHQAQLQIIRTLHGKKPQMAIAPSFEQIENLLGLIDALHRSQSQPLPGDRRVKAD